MRSVPLAGIALLVVAPTVRAQMQEPDEPSVELGPPPPPPPGAARTLEPDEPLPEAPGPLEHDAPPLAEPTIRPDEPPPLVVETQGEPAPSDRPTTYPSQSAVPGWYGWQILIGDAGAAAWALLPDTTGLVLGGAVFLLTGPAIHAGHKNGVKALGSFALRLGVPLATSMLLDEKGCYEPCVTPGIFVSAVVVSIIDAAWLAREDVPAQQKTLAITPSVAAGPKRLALSLGGSF